MHYDCSMKKKRIFIVIAAVVCLLAAAFAGIRFFLSKLVNTKLENALADMSDIAEIDFSKAGIDVFSASVYINDVQIALDDAGKEKIIIDKVNIYRMDTESEFPLFMKINLKGARLALTESDEPALPDFIDSLLNTPLDIYADYRFTPAKANLSYNAKPQNTKPKNLLTAASTVTDSVYDLSLNDLRITIPGAASFNFSFDAQNIDITDGTLSSAALLRAQLKYTDASLFPSAVTAIAESESITEEDVKGVLKDLLDDFANESNSAEIKNACDAVKDFIEKPESISITIEPQTPVLFSDLFSRFDIDVLRSLNVQVGLPQFSAYNHAVLRRKHHRQNEKQRFG